MGDKNLTEKEMVRQLYLNSIMKRRIKVLNNKETFTKYSDWVNKMAKDLLELGFSFQETQYIVNQAEDRAASYQRKR
ncbi:hypothetical protein [Sutcliffiella cohnii]|uniref:hypothetical protein n=1 Tax=Sutcliffiella cohnii TaxID=33932 RepID=UPI00082E112A|nr:hypothetical protein [Sutcliffiella cohnii]